MKPVPDNQSMQARVRRLRGRRPGFTLLEMLIVVSLVSAILGAVAVLLQGVWRAERGVRHHAAQYRAIHRAAELFREDVHAGNVDLAAGQGSASRLIVTVPEDRSIEYTADDARIDRVVRAGGEIALRDTFALPPGSTAKWQRDGEDFSIVSLLIETPLVADPAGMASTRELRVDAALHRPSGPGPQAGNE